MKETLHHLEPRDSVFEKIAELLSPGGEIMVLEPNAWNPMIQFEMLLKRGTRTIVEAVDTETGQPFLYGDERIMTPRYMRRRFARVGIQGTTEICRLLPTAISNIGPLAVAARWLERNSLDRFMLPLCVHAVFRGNKARPEHSPC